MIVWSCEILWLILVDLLSRVEGRYFFYQWTSGKNDKFNPHPLFVYTRILIMIFISLALRLEQYWYIDIMCFTAQFMMIHDGRYYVTRHNLDNNTYRLGYWDQSTTSSSWLDRKHLTTPYIRFALFVIGTIWLLIINL